jgi:hypothetical protein
MLQNRFTVKDILPSMYTPENMKYYSYWLCKGKTLDAPNHKRISYYYIAAPTVMNFPAASDGVSTGTAFGIG